MQHVVGISEMGVCNSLADELVTYSLGSCVGLALYDPQVRLAGMVHCMLPLSTMDPLKAHDRPCMFTDTGVTALLQAMFNAGAARSRLIAKAAGASNVLDERKLFNIGARNLAVLRKILWKNGILLAAEDTGGAIPRTLHLAVADGRISVRSGGREYQL